MEKAKDMFLILQVGRVVTFKDLRKKVSLEAQQNINFFKRLKDKPFWMWNAEEHKQEDIRTNGDCCFNHIVGLPTKVRTEKPLFDYEKLLYDSLLVNDYSNILNHTFKHKHLFEEEYRAWSNRVLSQVNGMAVLEK